MASRRDPSEQIDFVLRRHYSAAFTSQERRALVDLIRVWDDEHAHLDRHERVQGWLAIARGSLVAHAQ